MEPAIIKLTYAVLFTMALTCAVVVVFARNPVYCALALVATMVSLAGIFLLIQAPFVALIQIFVYAGAIMVLFLYIVMLLNPRRRSPVPAAVQGRRGIGFMLAAIFFLLSAAWILRVYATSVAHFTLEAPGVKAIVARMLQQYTLPFELTSVLLLVAIIGAVLIAKRD